MQTDVWVESRRSEGGPPSLRPGSSRNGPALWRYSSASDETRPKSHVPSISLQPTVDVA